MTPLTGYLINYFCPWLEPPSHSIWFKGTAFVFRVTEWLLWQFITTFFKDLTPVRPPPDIHTASDVFISACHTFHQKNKLLYCTTSHRVYPTLFIIRWRCLHSLHNVCLNTSPLSPGGFGPCSLMLMIYFSIWSYSVELPHGAMLQWTPAHSPSASAAATILHYMLLG